MRLFSRLDDEDDDFDGVDNDAADAPQEGAPARDGQEARRPQDRVRQGAAVRQAGGRDVREQRRQRIGVSASIGAGQRCQATIFGLS